MLVQTDLLRQNQVLPSGENLQTYCGLDCCVTLEVLEEILKVHERPEIYNFERALQGPYLEIMQRGILVDELSRRSAAQELRQRIALLQRDLDDFARAFWDQGLNPRSSDQLKRFFYGEMRIPEIYSYKKGKKNVSTERDALEKIEEQYLYARPFVQIILRIRDLAKQAEVFETEIDFDQRWRAGYNIAGTETGRSSSSENAFGTASNTQNVPEALRYPFVADPGKKICVIDMEQSEARDLGYLCGAIFGDWKFLDKCESGDLHTANAKEVWPELKWTGHPGQDRKVAEQIHYRDHTFRYDAKRLSHLTDYMGTAFTMARVLKMPQAMCEDFRQRYATGENAAYPVIPLYWQWVAQELQTKSFLTTPFGRQRHFFGRPGDDATLREAIAFIPQSMTADRMSLAMWRIWKYMPQVELLGNGYDSVMFQFSEKLDPVKVIGEALKHCVIPLVARGRTFIVPAEAKVGWNWGPRIDHDDIAKAQRVGQKPPRLNLDGLVKWNPRIGDPRKRAVGLQRIMM